MLLNNCYKTLPNGSRLSRWLNISLLRSFCCANLTLSFLYNNYSATVLSQGLGYFNTWIRNQRKLFCKKSIWRYLKLLKAKFCVVVPKYGWLVRDWSSYTTIIVIPALFQFLNPKSKKSNLQKIDLKTYKTTECQILCCGSKVWVIIGRPMGKINTSEKKIIRTGERQCFRFLWLLSWRIKFSHDLYNVYK